MTDQEAIRRELEDTIRAAQDGAFTAQKLMIDILGSGRPLKGFHVATYLSAQTERLIASWASDAIAANTTPEEALIEVRQRATDAIFKEPRSDFPMEKAIAEHAKNVFKEFLAFTQHLVGENAIERRSGRRYTLDIATDSVRSQYESAVVTNNPMLEVIFAETLFTLTTGYIRAEAPGNTYAEFEQELRSTVTQKLREEGRL